MATKDGWSAEAYNKNASFVYSKEFTTPVLDLLRAQPGERILDFGCGSGELTLQLKELVGPEGIVIGIDSSVNMVHTQSSTIRFGANTLRGSRLIKLTRTEWILPM